MQEVDRREILLWAAAAFLMAVLWMAVAMRSEAKSDGWDPVIDPAQFVREVDNPYFPLPVGRILRYRGETSSGTETLEIEVTSRTKLVMGVATTVVVERHAVDGEIEEISENWFAQDRDGTVWYFGEFSQIFDGGQPVGSPGSWEAGLAGARPGIIMKAQPQPGDTYYQEFAPGIAEDQARVVSTGRSATVPFGTFEDVLVTKEWTALESSSVEHKSYARGIGLISEAGGSERLDLVEMSR